MKKNHDAKSSKFLKKFEIGKSKQSNVVGGTPIWLLTAFTIDGSAASGYACPDYRQDLYP